MMITKNQAKRLKQLICDHKDAQIDDAFKGSMPYEHHNVITRNSIARKKELFQYINYLTEEN